MTLGIMLGGGGKDRCGAAQAHRAIAKIHHHWVFAAAEVRLQFAKFAQAGHIAFGQGIHQIHGRVIGWRAVWLKLKAVIMAQKMKQ